MLADFDWTNPKILVVSASAIKSTIDTVYNKEQGHWDRFGLRPGIIL